MLAMEDLSFEGYKTAQIARLLNQDELRLVLNALENLHQASKEMKEKDPALFEELASTLREAFCVGRMYDGVLEKCFNNAVNCSNKYLPESYKEKLEKFDYISTKDWILQGNTDSAVFLHGDSWSCNFLFKYEKDVPIDVAIVDWQMCRVGSPMLDVSELLFSSTSGSECPSVPECAFGFMMAFIIIPFAYDQADPIQALTPEKLVFANDIVPMRRIADIVKVAIDKGIIS